MTGAFLYLTQCSIRNGLRVRLRRLRQPRYLIGLIVGVLYFYFLMFRPSRGRSRSPIDRFPAIDRFRGIVELAGTAMLFLSVALAWIWPGQRRPALAFSRADVHFLFTAPITRRQLVRYKVLRSQVGAVIGSAFMTIFFRPGNLADSWMFFVGLLLVMATLNLHMTAVSLSRSSLGQHGWAGLARQWVPVTLVVTAVAVIGGTLAVNWSHLSSLDPGAIVREVERLSSTGLAGIVLFPFRALARLPLAEAPADFFRALPVVLLMLAANFVWVERSDAAFEEASAELAEKVAKIRRTAGAPSPRVRTLATPFTLTPQGPAEMAFLWKNLILVGRYISHRLLIRVLPPLVIVGVMLSSSGRGRLAETLAIFCLAIGAMAIMLGPQIARNDLRQDLANLAVLKTWPVRGAAMVRGEVLAPTMVVSGIAWTLIIGATFLSTNLKFLVSVSIWSRLSYALAAILLSTGLILVQVVVQNALAVMFPAWVQIGVGRSRGIDVMGQRLLMMAGLMLVLVVAVLPAALAGGLVGFAIYSAIGIIPVVVPAAVATAVLVGESLLAIEAIGRVLDRTDPTAVEVTE